MPVASTAGVTRTEPTSRCFWCVACSVIRRSPAGCAISVNPSTAQRFCRGPIAGVGDDECDALVTDGADDPRWSPAERTLVEAVDELERTGSWSESTWTALGRELGDEQRIELLTAVRWYRTICTLCNALALPVEVDPTFRIAPRPRGTISWTARVA